MTLAALGLCVAMSIACSDDGAVDSDSDNATESSSGDGDGDTTTTAETSTTDDTEGQTETTGPDCDPGTFGCECDNGMCIDGLECDSNNECTFGDPTTGDGDGDDGEPNDPTLFDCASTEAITFSNFFGNPDTLIIEAEVNEIEGALFFLDFWVEGAGTFNLADPNIWDDTACGTHCVYMLSQDGSWWAADGEVTIDEWVTWHVNRGSVTGLVLQQTQLNGNNPYDQDFIENPTCYSVEDFEWDTISEGGDGDGDMTGDGDGDMTGDGDGDMTGDGDGDMTGDGDGDMGDVCMMDVNDNECVACTKNDCCEPLTACEGNELCMCTWECIEGGDEPGFCLEVTCESLDDPDSVNISECVLDACNEICFP